MWGYLVILAILVFIIYMIRTHVGSILRKRDFSMERPNANKSIIIERTNELGANEGLGLMNLSGLTALADEICGIYLFPGKVLFETQGSTVEISKKQINRVFIDSYSDITYYNDIVPKKSFFFIIIPPQNKKPSPDYVTESTLVFEYIKENNSKDYIIFSIAYSQLDEVSKFIEHYS